jgi:hypothetical protein
VPDGHADRVPDDERAAQHRDAPSRIRFGQHRAVNVVVAVTFAHGVAVS